LNQHQVVI